TVGSAPPVPEPGCVALLSVGCLALLRRRRK
ncbi:MAG: PEP-CTERM sorting domain-containing protein, partial [Phycisphaerae bacterium]|nr:PEP-CTERM sorting domain-containing protein [Phycisphaerae bacterium]